MMIDVEGLRPLGFVNDNALMMLAALRTNWFILRTGIEERLVYRGDFAFATLVREQFPASSCGC